MLARLFYTRFYNASQPLDLLAMMEVESVRLSLGMEAVMCATVPVSDIDAWSAKSFAQDHFGTADLGHKKRNAALVRTAAQIFRHPGGTLHHQPGAGC